ncbi:MAG: hypothetical protein MMC23_008466 [Stictis urceolatum]|nr:hypothetical protein [Stictis urceolata]
MHPLITLEEHYIAPSLGSTPEAEREFAGFPPLIMDKLRDLGEQRISEMDAGHVSLQVVSHAPIVATPAQCSDTNDGLAAAVATNPSRLKGFALLPMSNPEAAAAELERAVKQLGFVGCLIDNHLEGRFYDDESFWPVFAKAQELDTPVYIHPTFASETMMPRYDGNYDDFTAKMLGGPGWGWHVETGLHILRLYASGLFDRFPRLKIIIGHMGELLPYQLERTLRMDNNGEGRGYGRHARSFQKVWDENLWITTSGMFGMPSFACMVQTTKLDRILYSVDYPFSSNETGSKFISDIRRSGLLTEEQLLDFSYRNAEKLLGVKVS